MARVVDAISLRTGAMDGGWLPATATTMAHLLQQGTAREAEVTTERLGRLPYSRSSFERVGHVVGQLYTVKQTDINDALVVAETIPPAAQSVSVGVDRVSLPMEEPRRRPVGRPRNDAPARPVQHVYRMAYCTTITFHDATGTALHTIRHGAVPTVEPVELCDRMLADVLAIREQRPDLAVILLSDGAPELRTLLRTALDEATVGTPLYELLDFCHLLEKLAAAARVIYAESETAAVLARWRVGLLNRNAAPDTILAALEQSGRQHVRVGASRPVHEAITYINNHRELLGYPRARRRGLPIGSGVTEATCKTLFTVRMKRSGARWKTDTARDVINLRAHRPCRQSRNTTRTSARNRCFTSCSSFRPFGVNRYVLRTRPAMIFRCHVISPSRFNFARVGYTVPGLSSKPASRISLRIAIP